MGDLSAEPSMEEILSSIKRIIAEEGEGPGRPRRAPPPRPTPVAAPPASPMDEVLELSDPMPATPAAAELSRRAQMTEPAAEPRAYAGWPPEPSPAAARPAEPAPPPPPIASADTVEASREALESLSRVKGHAPEPGDGTLEGAVREMLRPMLRDWLDAHLPAIVEAMVAREIARISAVRD